jgi:hypothetical protein
MFHVQTFSLSRSRNREEQPGPPAGGLDCGLCSFDNGTPRGVASALPVGRIAIVILGKGRWRLIKARLPEIAAAVNAATPGRFIEVEILLD